ncbi:hypothetical protein K2173_017185 [Erythroxylum novogranatense]|uniref:PRA1 family protein n=1 Tax=Erythroxylum novogranatense TaxID=1862640 RepID=A0AAV8U992_9ROSI|nr:hypothetical protein K2173_017185 [Erythroxylum novogranatense]
MDTGGIIQRPSIVLASPSVQQAYEDENGKHNQDFTRPEFKLVCPFKIPSNPDAAALRIIRNLSHFRLYYAHFVWIVLFITLIPKRKVSLIYMVIITYVASLYLLLLRALPGSLLFHRVIDKRLVLCVLAFIAMVGLIATQAALHLVVTLAATIPIVLVHAVLWVNVNVDGASDMAPLLQASRDMV